MRPYNNIVTCCQLISLLILCFLFPAAMYRENSTNLEKFHLKIKADELYAEDEPLVNILLHEMATKPILHVRKYQPQSVVQLNNLFLSTQHQREHLVFIKLARAHVYL